MGLVHLIIYKPKSEAAVLLSASHKTLKNEGDN